MANYVIHPIPFFELQGEQSLITFQRGFGRQGTGVNYVWYVEGAPEKIVIDAGGDIDFVAQAKGKIPVTEIQSLESGLSKFGIEAGDIDLVIVTHLHFDHIQLASKFVKAKFLVQKNEWEFAQKAHPMMPMLGYIRQYYDNLKFELLDGDAEIYDGLSVLYTPGHSPGGQSVSIRTSQGKAVIAGLCAVQRNFEPPPHIAQFMPIIPVGIYTDILETYDSMVRIKDVADIIIPLHEEKFKTINRIP
jgi:glyoxylase-like metal-dependent hydrolase (beta-lactamase superfamily II)